MVCISCEVLSILVWPPQAKKRGVGARLELGQIYLKTRMGTAAPAVVIVLFSRPLLGGCMQSITNVTTFVSPSLK